MKLPVLKILVGLALTISWTSFAQTKPNIVLIMADDLGWGDTGYNGNTIIKTPYLDQMAGEGIQFNRFYAACSVCSPTRASVLTGRNPYRMGVFNANAGILRPEEITLPELLKEQGYATGHFGKWHLGTLTHAENDANRGKPGNIAEYNPPALHGYDCAFVTESKVPTWDPMKKPVSGATREGWNYIKENEDYKPYGTYYWDIDGNKVTDNLEGDDSRIIMDRVLPFIEKAVSKDTPFFTVIWFHAPHLPVVAGPEYREMYAGHNDLMKNYAGCITALDEQVGRLRSFLKEEGVAENTMIWFCSDNGPELRTPGSSGMFREKKRSLHEGGIRVPGLLVWPAKIKDRFETDIPCVTSDYLPTILDILNIDKNKVPYTLDGISLLPLIDGNMKNRSTPIAFYYGNQAVWSNNQYKLYTKSNVPELYDIVADPSEKNDLNLLNKRTTKKSTKKLQQFLESCKKSFDGEEYGNVSVKKLNQEWNHPMKENKDTK